MQGDIHLKEANQEKDEYQKEYDTEMEVLEDMKNKVKEMEKTKQEKTK